MSSHVNLIVGCAAGLISVATLWLLRSNRKINEATWDELLARLKPLHMEGVALVAVEYLNPGHSALSTEPSNRYSMLGGSDGLRTMSRNANILLALASHAERWDKGESKQVAKLMRQDGIALRRAVRQIRIRKLFAQGNAAKSVYVQVVAAKYYQMSGRLLGLYRHIPSSGFASLDSALWRHSG